MERKSVIAIDVVKPRGVLHTNAPALIESALAGGGYNVIRENPGEPRRGELKDGLNAIISERTE